jgi:hypothetical protein
LKKDDKTPYKKRSMIFVLRLCGLINLVVGDLRLRSHPQPSLKRSIFSRNLGKFHDSNESWGAHGHTAAW